MKTVDDLEAALATVSPGLLADIARLEGDIVVLGAAGKLGPSLVNLACRAIEQAGTGARVYAVSRFGTPGSAEEMAAYGAEVIKTDISTDEGLASVPDAPNVIFLVGAKFGTDGNEHGTWATNTYLPGRVAERFAGSRIAALSTGNVYHLSKVSDGGSIETDIPNPAGDYAMSCLGRERIFTHFAHRDNTPMSIIRLNYAVEMRYGVLVDIATKIKSGTPVDVTMGFANIVWQGYCNEVIIRSLLHADVPPFLLNLTGPETLSIRRTAQKMAAAMGAEVEIVGEESDTALLSDSSKCMSLFGYPDKALDELITATAEWVKGDGPLLDKPTHFQTRDGKF
ncbi:NAD-dependent epimerase/dehydratase family protein [Propionibacteriaceae bacterium Y1700]|uniref:NAD-dependent epimerase/dehydratase family protein n=1 Tax=Microlunatus sp. Y1700 TaxID=3418487 RepID=UPI003DA79302